MRIAVLGGGVMGEALIAGISRDATLDARIVLAEKRAERAEQLRDQYGLEVADSLAGAVRDADVVIVVVKPQDIRPVLDAIAPDVRDDALIVSIAAGITTASIEQAVPQAHVVRAMPNTPARIESGVTGISAGSRCPASSVAVARTLLSSVGTVIEIPEDLQDAITAVSGSGPAYVFYLAEAMMAAARDLGLSDRDAREAVVHTLLGAARLLESSAADPAELRANVTSPGGTTAAAIAVMDAEGIRDSIGRAMLAARDRSRELSAS